MDIHDVYKGLPSTYKAVMEAEIERRVEIRLEERVRAMTSDDDDRQRKLLKLAHKLIKELTR